jgi:O-methyltransferase involved in polyketide biosynthesis
MMKSAKNSAMSGVNKTMYIPLYGKAFVSSKGLFLSDKMAEKIWSAERFSLKGKAKSKWLAYYMGIRSAVFDEWLVEKIGGEEFAAVLHIGCGMDSRVLRVGTRATIWYDIDFPEVIAERKKYFAENSEYRMISCDVRDTSWLDSVKTCDKAVVVMEGVAMYMRESEIRCLLSDVCERFESVSVLMDCYSVFAAKMSKYKNPINSVGVTKVYGIDSPEALAPEGLSFKRSRDMTPEGYIDELRGMERFIFKKLYSGKFARKLYKLYEFSSSEQ